MEYFTMAISRTTGTTSCDSPIADHRVGTVRSLYVRLWMRTLLCLWDSPSLKRECVLSLSRSTYLLSRNQLYAFYWSFLYNQTWNYPAWCPCVWSWSYEDLVFSQSLSRRACTLSWDWTVFHIFRTNRLGLDLRTLLPWKWFQEILCDPVLGI